MHARRAACRQYLPYALRQLGLFQSCSGWGCAPFRQMASNVGKPTQNASAEFASVTDADMTFFSSTLGSTGVLTHMADTEKFNQDWMKLYKGRSSCVLLPSTVTQVQAVLSHCHQRNLAVVPQGGNTGLVGGSVPVKDEVVLSMTKMDKIIQLDPVSGVLVCESGCILQVLDEYCRERGYMMPLDLGAKGSCHIGGNVSTNAGGIRLLRYGSLHGSVLGLEVVLADGTLLDLLKPLRKDNTGYHLKHLFIGGEGTLGVVTKVSLQCPRQPASVHVAMLAVPSWSHLQQLLQLATSRLAEILSAFEFLDDQSLQFVLSTGRPRPLSTASPLYVVLETHGSSEAHDSEKMEAFLQEALSSGLVLDGTLAQDSAQQAGIWGIREGIPEALSRTGAVYKFDVSLDVGLMYDLVTAVREQFQDKFGVQPVGYGHVGDGNLHLNVWSPAVSPELEAELSPWVYRWVGAAGGSISAEHGIGRMKAPYLHLSKPQPALDIMRQLKQLLDPKGILNPYKVLV